MGNYFFYLENILAETKLLLLLWNKTQIKLIF